MDKEEEKVLVPVGLPDMRRHYSESHPRRNSTSMISKRCSQQFSIKRDTEANFSLESIYIDDDEEFTCQGPYAHIRKTLDYGYHIRYRKDRQWLQDSIIDKLLHEVVQNDNYSDHIHSLAAPSSDDQKNNENSSSSHVLTESTKRLIRPRSSSSLGSTSHSNFDLENLLYLPTDPWLIYIVGRRGVTRSAAISALFKKNCFPILSFVLVDPYEIRNLLPEYRAYVQMYGEKEGIRSTRKEAGFIAEILTRAALQTGTNVIVFSSFHNVDWYPTYFRELRAEFNHLQIAILQVLSCDEDVEDKGENTEFGHIIQTVEKLIEHVDFHSLLKLSSNETELTILSNGITWQSFNDTFHQTSSHLKCRPQSPEDTCHRGESGFIQSFDVNKSTEENYKSDDMAFFGAYSHLRKLLDYTYHKNYRKDRQRLQDAIISDTLDAPRIVDHFGQICTTPTEPFLVFTAGKVSIIHVFAMGAGKSHTLNSLAEKGLFPLSAFVLIDPDQIRQQLPEYSLYVAQNQLTAGEFTRKEAGYVVEILTLAGLQSGKNVLVDTSLRDCEWYKEYFETIQKDYPNVRIAILYIDAPREAVLKRAEARGKLTGRVIPQETLEKALEQVPKSVAVLRNKVHHYCKLYNAPGSDIEICTEGMDWDNFKQLWIQTCAWIPKERQRIKISTKNTDKCLLLNE